MRAGNQLLGKVFISHTSVDKPFVRRVARRLERARFKTWLDERELLPGDRLTERIAEAVAAAKVVLVVVSTASVRSKWLSYELDLAAERMVKGKCRVIPLVISAGQLPASVQGLLYADFRQSFELGMRGLLTALRYEAKRTARTAGFGALADELVGTVFGSRILNIRLGDFDGRVYDVLNLDIPSDGNTYTPVVYDKVLARPGATLLDEQWWEGYSRARSVYDESLFLVLTERSVGLRVHEHDGLDGRVKYRTFFKDVHDAGHVIFADLARLRSDDRRSAVVAKAKERLTQLAQELRGA